MSPELWVSLLVLGFYAEARLSVLFGMQEPAPKKETTVIWGKLSRRHDSAEGRNKAINANAEEIVVLNTQG